MSNRYKLVLLILGLVVALPLGAYAAGEDPEDKNPKKKKVEEDSLSIAEKENKIVDEILMPDVQKMNPVLDFYTTPVKKESTAQKEEKKENKDEEDNSAMSFNFIYYIIDTFKFTDPLD